MLRIATEYLVREDHVEEFESDFSATGSYGGLWVSWGCLSYTLLRHKFIPRQYLVIVGWAGWEAVMRAMESLIHTSFKNPNRMAEWFDASFELGSDSREDFPKQEELDGQYEILSEFK